MGQSVQGIFRVIPGIQEILFVFRIVFHQGIIFIQAVSALFLDLVEEGDLCVRHGFRIFHERLYRFRRRRVSGQLLIDVVIDGPDSVRREHEIAGTVDDKLCSVCRDMKTGLVPSVKV